MSWLFMILAIVFEVAGTISMKFSSGFTKLYPVMMTLICYLLSLAFFALALKKIDISIAYAMWSGLGIVLITVVGVYWFEESASILKLISILFIIIGVIGLNLSKV
ncbi:DMT family transporter [Desertibacillus haloalkaliphilus]|uniref:DMT family transporter n=1 Tax=Desertibacillus haloalkaliphilus TaxID=1328930 RepID=UPI001C27FCCB|nr:multidrug efflux SMR transporter [Desertibacillus haloalkaliphilus]MBU8908908.1 multidrug efflux SMR transporter [Desertibacillus haloalkaliphilus]